MQRLESFGASEVGAAPTPESKKAMAGAASEVLKCMIKINELGKTKLKSGGSKELEMSLNESDDCDDAAKKL